MESVQTKLSVDKHGLIKWPGSMTLLRSVRVPDGLQQRAALGTVVSQKDGRGEVSGVGIDGEAEEDELDQGDADHHPERQAVPAHLDELLDDDRPEPRRREFASLHDGEFNR